MTKEEVLEIIYPASAAKHFGVEKTSYLHKEVEEVSEKLSSLIKENENKSHEKIDKTRA